MEAMEIFRSFYAEEDAASLANLLREQGLEVKVEKTKLILDKYISGDGLDRPWHVRIKAADFNNANRIIDRQVSEGLHQLGDDYYLFAFSDAELMEILHKPDEWNNQDVLFAQKILADRGTEISSTEMDKLRQERLFEMAKPEAGKRSSIIMGYVVAILFTPVAIFVALYMLTAKKVLPNGSKVYSFDKATRDHWSIIMVIAILLTLLIFVTGLDHYISSRF